MNNFTIWKNAVALEEAYVRYAHKEDADRYRSLSAENSLTAMIERAEKRLQDGEAGWDALSNSVGPYSELSELRQKLCQQCRAWVTAGKLKAYGFAVPRHPNDEPLEVPDYLWDGFINWDRSKVENHGLKMEGIRLILPTWIERLFAEASAQPEGRGPGRRSRKSQIMQAFEALDRLDQIDYEKPMAKIFPRIREMVLQAHSGDPDGEKGLDDKTIAKHLGKPFNARKANSKL